MSETGDIPLEPNSNLMDAEVQVRSVGGPRIENILEIVNSFSKARIQAMTTVMGLKDSLNKKSEVTRSIEEMSAIFSQLSVLCGTTDGNDLTNKNMSNLVDKVEKIQSAGTSYADKIKAATAKVQITANKKVTPNLNKAIILTQRDPEGPLRSCEDTKKQIMNKLKPENLGLKPERITNFGKNGIRITAKDIDEEKVSKLALNKAGLDFKIVGKFQPRLAIFGVPAELEAEDLKEGILNELDLDQEKLTVKHKFGPKGKHGRRSLYQKQSNSINKRAYPSRLVFVFN
ncbi:unnamed protein product [Psylliodes chrysocephalus]|uniref:Uncharacterized protein n=1 Tax=Psylliodes chrysocephalus TaxID=3402493 RepID=A0A9P0CXB4_9CUCU|nr:unnamed protein product [Psylliodes chrysocephala]